MSKKFIAKYTPEAENDLKNLQKQDIKKVLRVIAIFEELGADAVNSRSLNNDGLFEIKCDKIRIYFMYQNDKLIIIGLIALKKDSKST